MSTWERQRQHHNTADDCRTMSASSGVRGGQLVIPQCGDSVSAKSNKPALAHYRAVANFLRQIRESQCLSARTFTVATINMAPWEWSKSARLSRTYGTVQKLCRG